MKRLQRHLLREMFRSVLLLLLVLLAVTLGALLADALAQVARGRITPDMLLAIMGLNTLEALRLLLPLAVFVGTVLALTRLAQDRELTVMLGSGLSPAGVLAAQGWLLWPAFVLMVGLSLWLVPWADRVSDSLAREAGRKLGVSILQPGRFRALPDGGVVYVRAVQAEANRFERFFLYLPQQGRERLVLARSGHEQPGDTSRVVLEQGWMLQGDPAGQAWQRVQFQAAELQLPGRQHEMEPTELENVPLRDLFRQKDRQAWSEIRFRLSAAWSVWSLGLLALPLSILGPRAGRHGRIALALVIFVVHGNLAQMARGWYESGAVPGWLGLEWVHLLPPLLGLWLWGGQTGRGWRLRTRHGA